MKRVYDGIIGLAVGDVLGVPVEFMSRQEIDENPVAYYLDKHDWMKAGLGDMLHWSY